MSDDAPTGRAEASTITLEDLIDGFHRLQVEHARVAQHVGMQNGLNPTDLRVLKYLGLASVGDEAATPKSVGTYLQMSRGAVTALLDRLESRGFLERSGNPRDRRITFLTLTPDGIQIVDRVRAAYGRAIDASIPADLRADFLSGCRALSRALDTQVTDDIARHADGAQR